MNKNLVNILGTNISNIKKQDILEKINEFIKSDQSHYIVTPNPEILLKTKIDEELYYILNKADLAIPDGIGLKIASWFRGTNLDRITGADLLIDILKIAQNLNKKVIIFNLKGGLSNKEEIKEVVNKVFPKIICEIKEIDQEGRMVDYEEINNFKPDVLVVSLGSPWQEKIMYHSLKKINTIKLGICVGGSFDYLTKKTVRASKIFRIIGLEWLWRLIIQPENRLRRLKRIYKAVIIFPLHFFIWQYVNPWRYRKNVACFLFKKQENAIYVFLAERESEEKNWQLPQGGTDGEEVCKAGERELREEINSDKFKTVEVFKNIYKYSFKNQVSRAGVKSNFIKGYKGQKQSLFIAEFIGDDSDIKVNYWDHSNWKWVKIDDLLNEVHETRKEATTIFLKKFKETMNIK